MGVVDKLTALASSFRRTYGITDKYSLDDMIAGFGGLEAHNYVDDIKPDVYVQWNDGVGSYSHDNSEIIKNRDISRTAFKNVTDGKYYLTVEMKGKGTFGLYAWPTTEDGGSFNHYVTLTDQWTLVSLRIQVADGSQPTAFIRDNSDHEAKSFQIRNIKLVKLK